MNDPTITPEAYVDYVVGCYRDIASLLTNHPGNAEVRLRTTKSSVYVLMVIHEDLMTTTEAKYCLPKWDFNKYNIKHRRLTLGKVKQYCDPKLLGVMFWSLLFRVTDHSINKDLKSL